MPTAKKWEGFKEMAKIISCAGYYNTGSSAVTDFFSEFDNVVSLGETEFKFLQDCDGVQALETNLIEHPHRHNSGHAIKRFIKAAKFENGNFFSKRYRKFFGDNYMKLTMEYVEEITQLKTESHWRGDAIERGGLFYMADALVSVLSGKLFGEKNRTSLMTLLHDKNYFTAVDKEKFYEATKRYTSRLLESAGKNAEFIMVDQLVPPSEPMRYMNYVDNMKIVVVDRDPRDVFAESVIEYPRYKGVPNPVDEYCEWYRLLREHRKTDAPCADSMLIHLEDLIYRYDDTVRKLMDFTGLIPESHKRPQTKFIPSVSIKNTQKWKQYPDRKKDFDYIENHLQEYLYSYTDFR